MSRKTFHHLQVGDLVPMEHYQMDPQGDLVVVETCTGIVDEVLVRRVVISHEFDRGPDQFSKQSGYLWGSGIEEGYRISPEFARRKL